MVELLMTESQYVTDIIKEIEKLGGKAVKFVETEHSEKGTPDIIGCVNGRCFVIEAKIEPNTASRIQKQRIQKLSKAGAFAFITSYPTHSAKSVANYVVGVLKW